jgi:hypothetical protein
MGYLEVRIGLPFRSSNPSSRPKQNLASTQQTPVPIQQTLASTRQILVPTEVEGPAANTTQLFDSAASTHAIDTG